MPSVNATANTYFLNFLKTLQRRIKALETQQNWGITTPRSMILRMRGGLQSDKTFGIVAFDNTGNPRTQMGELPNGDYGLAYYSLANDGTYEELFPTASDYGAGSISTSTTAYTTGDGSPSITVVLGASGDAILTASAFIQTTTDQTGTLGLSIDSGAAVEVAELGVSGSMIAGNVSSCRRLSQWVGALSPGNHNFTLQQKTSTSGVATVFGALSLLVQPI